MRKPLGATLLALAMAGAGAAPVAAAPADTTQSFGKGAGTGSVTSVVRDTVASVTAGLVRRGRRTSVIRNESPMGSGCFSRVRG